MAKIRFFLDDEEELIQSERFHVNKIEHYKEGYSLIEVCGDLADIAIKRPCGMIIRPKRSINTNGFTFITAWAESLL